MDLLIWKLLSVVGTSAFELWAGFPLGLSMDLPPWLIGAAAALGAWLAVLAVLIVRQVIPQRQTNTHSDKLVYRLARRYGACGLGLLGVIAFGAPLAMLTGLALGLPARSLFTWHTVGIGLWSLVGVSLLSLGQSL
ncbi:hypothetical protein [Chitinivorax sp. B]|uniref:hypothetical protein n=1 Tax=Chitinivorax sp. B TaxID=2502235 RepID=UPI0010F713C8|nr:hypothetical protein [Chitinivorax sp. B]